MFQSHVFNFITSDYDGVWRGPTRSQVDSPFIPFAEFFDPTRVQVNRHADFLASFLLRRSVAGKDQTLSRHILKNFGMVLLDSRRTCALLCSRNASSASPERAVKCKCK